MKTRKIAAALVLAALVSAALPATASADRGHRRVAKQEIAWTVLFTRIWERVQQVGKEVLSGFEATEGASITPNG
jgi:hypothetical protein